MSWTFLRQEKVKARKIHRCTCCGEDILIGEIYEQRTGADNTSKEIITMRMHKECKKASSEWDDEDWETFMSGEMERPSYENMAR